MRNGPNFETNPTPMFEVKLEIVRYKLQVGMFCMSHFLRRWRNLEQY